jgi:DNA (cytosine-5)-methyltransferase 1
VGVRSPHAVRRNEQSKTRKSREKSTVSSQKSVALFAGTGGFALGMQRSAKAAAPALFCEIDRAARSVLSTWQPLTPIHSDIRTLEDLPAEDVLVLAALPGNDTSPAGLKRGIEGEGTDLLQNTFRLIARRKPSTVIMEMVPFALRLEKGAALEAVTSALHHLGYSWAYRTVDSQFFGVPQRRQRVYIVSSRIHDPREILLADDAGPSWRPDPGAVDITRQAVGFYWAFGTHGWGMAVDSIPPLRVASTVNIPTVPAVLLPDGTVGTPQIEDGERLQALPTDWTKPADAVERNARWRLVGLAVTSSVPEWLGSRLANPGRYDASRDPARRPSAPWPNAAWNLGQGIHASSVSDNPLAVPMPRISGWLSKSLQPLSARATRGFLNRAAKGTLRFPRGFLDALTAHADRMSAEPVVQAGLFD